jgi:thioesterase domain-containing protein/acyl carrier protein
MRRLDGGLNLAAIRRVVPTDLEPETTSSNNDARSSQFSSTFVQNMVQGINPAEGVRAFDHALQRGETEVQISAINPRELRRQTSDLAETLTRPITVGASTLFSRPRLEQDYVAPRNDVEATLADFWQELLGIDQVGICDSFFDLGGHSIIAVRFFAKIRRSFGVDLPISVLFEAPTIEACARLLEPHREDGEPSRSESAGASASRAVTRSRLTHVVAMNDVAAFDDTPLFMAAGMFGNVLNLRQLAEELGTHRRFYGLQARGLFGGTPPHETFESMATDYLAEIRQIQPDGPYLLGGFSGGGVVAFEMARQLRALGEKVDGLIMLDTPAPLPTPRMTFRERVRFQLDNHEQQGMRYLTSWPTRRLAWERARRAASSITEEQPEVLHSAEIEAAFRRALAAYRVRPYDGVITLLRPKLQPTHVFSPTRRVDDSRNFLFDDNRWGGYCRRVDVIEVPGTHDSMVLQPNVSVLARHIDRVLSSPTAARR